MYRAEAEGLREIASVQAVRVPAVHDCGLANGESFIAIEWLDIEPGSASTERLLGEQLATMHRHTAKQHGWHRDNTIGKTPQHNPWSDDWVVFFRDHRLLFQLELAANNGYSGELQALGTKLIDKLPAVIVGRLRKY